MLLEERAVVILPKLARGRVLTGSLLRITDFYTFSEAYRTVSLLLADVDGSRSVMGENIRNTSCRNNKDDFCCGVTHPSSMARPMVRHLINNRLWICVLHAWHADKDSVSLVPIYNWDPIVRLTEVETANQPMRAQAHVARELGAAIQNHHVHPPWRLASLLPLHPLRRDSHHPQEYTCSNLVVEQCSWGFKYDATSQPSKA
jgi:hypothetical protein